MYGMIHKAAREFTIQNHGEERWRAILAKTPLSSEHFISGQHYADDDTFALLGAVSEDLGVDIDQLLSDFGRYWIKFTAESDYAAALRMCGDDLVTFLRNLDDLHRGVMTTMPEAVLPSFSVEHSDSSRIDLLYQSDRAGLASFVTGLLQGLMDKFSETGSVTYATEPDGLMFHIART